MESEGGGARVKGLRVSLVAALAAFVTIVGLPLATAQQAPTPAPSQPLPPPPLKGKTPSVSASIDPNQADVGYQGTLTGNSSSARPGSAGATHSGGGGRCTGISYTNALAQYGQAQVDLWLYGTDWWVYAPYTLPEVGQKPDPQHVGTPNNMYLVICGGVATSYGYVFPSTTTVAAPALPAPSTVAQTVAGQIPLPGVSIGIAPKDKGLTGLNAWFWVAGLPAGGAFTASAPALGATVNVEARPTSYVWDFGDQTSSLTTASSGVPYPGTDGPAAIHHMYQAENQSPGYPLSLTFVLAVRYQVNGGPWTDLGTVQRTISVTYPVEQVRSVITSRG
jgi:hypothetical protein